MQVTVVNASAYSINSGTEMAYQLDYSEGTQVRAVEGPAGFRKESKTAAGVWAVAGRAYVVPTAAKRQAERVKNEVRKFLSA